MFDFQSDPALCTLHLLRWSCEAGIINPVLQMSTLRLKKCYDSQWEKGYFPLFVISLLSLRLLVEIVATPPAPPPIGFTSPGSTESEKGGELMLVISLVKTLVICYQSSGQ